jgi:hypothetical protein
VVRDGARGCDRAQTDSENKVGDQSNEMEKVMAKSECCGAGKSEQADANPMEMGMGMAKRMMAQMGQGDSHMDMMQKMMGQMGGGEGKPQMEKMMGMCMGVWGEMLNAVKQTNALAVQATPELQQVFAEWLKRLEDEALAVLAKGTADAATLANALKISEASALYLLTHLAASGRIALSGRVQTKEAAA